jgi:hypothetical protein
VVDHASDVKTVAHVPRSYTEERPRREGGALRFSTPRR